MLSRQYTGQNSTISKVTEDGKEGMFGKINHKWTGVKRFAQNSIFDN